MSPFGPKMKVLFSWPSIISYLYPNPEWINPVDFDRKSGHLATSSEGAETFFPESPPYFGYLSER